MGNAAPRQSRTQQFFTSLNQKRTDAMRALLLNSTPSVLRPTFTKSNLLAFTLALLVHALSLTLAASGIYLVAVNGQYFCTISPAIVLLILAWAARPRFGKFPQDAVLTPAEAPTLYVLANSMAQALNTTPVDGIQLTGKYNAAFGRFGLRQRRLLILGKPLWDVLQGQEQIALLAHELAHAVNGDFNRKLVVHSARDALLIWLSALRPGRVRLRKAVRQGQLAYVSSESIWDILANTSMTPFALVVSMYERVLRFLLWHESRRAEYLADYLGATISGTPAMCSMLGKLWYGRRFIFYLQRGPYNTKKMAQRDYQEFISNVIKVPAEQAIGDINQDPVTNSDLDKDHPPIGYRIEFLNTHPITDTRIMLSAEDEQKIRAELNAAANNRYKDEPRIQDDTFLSRPAGTS